MTKLCKTNKMKQILEKTKGRKIYVQLQNGYFASISRNELKTVLKAMQSNKDDLDRVTASEEGTTGMIFISFYNKM